MTNFNLKKNKLNSISIEETFAFGFEIGKSCLGGEVFLLFGDLGAGKTSLTQGIAKGLSCSEVVNSPTFNILKVYKLKNKNKKIKSFCHVDAYRLSSGEDLINIGIDDYISSPEVVSVIEWAEKVEKIWPEKAIKIKLEIIGENKRAISLS